MGKQLKEYNIAIVGVGGQGILTLGYIIGVACTIAGRDVSIAEVHGMSQRGGSVIVHVRIGEKPSPIIPIGGADHILALELIELARYVNYARKGAIAVANDFVWPPPLSKYPSRDTIVNALKNKDLKLYLLDANALSSKYTGSAISANIALLGYALGVDSVLRELVPLTAVEKAMEEVFRGRTLEANLKLLHVAFEEGLKLGERG